MLPQIQNAGGLVSALQEAKVEVTQAGEGELFTKFDYKTGDFLMGRDAENIVDETVLVHTDSISHGWVIWNDGKPIKTLVNFTQALPPQPDPIATGKINQATKQEIINYPSESRGILFATDDGLQTIMEGSSYGVRKGVDNLLQTIRQRAMDPANADYLYPKVKLGNESYEQATYGTVFNPTFTVVAWCDNGGNEQGETKKIAAKETKTAPVEEPVEEVVEKKAAPKRRRRSAA